MICLIIPAQTFNSRKQFTLITPFTMTFKVLKKMNEKNLFENY